MKILGEPQLLPEENRQQSWRVLFEANCNALFQTALLLTADPESAEAGIAAAIGSLDVSRPPESDDLPNLHWMVARQAIQSIRPVRASDADDARSLLQRELWPVLQIEQSPRICFVLRMLLGCATSSCARMLGIEEAGVRTLLRIAILQLHHAVIRQTFVGFTDEASDSRDVSAGQLCRETTNTTKEVVQETL